MKAFAESVAEDKIRGVSPTQKSQEEGHLPTHAEQRFRMSSPTPPEPEGVPYGRLAVWIVLGVVLLIGVYLYFRYESNITPLIGRVD